MADAGGGRFGDDGCVLKTIYTSLSTPFDDHLAIATSAFPRWQFCRPGDYADLALEEVEGFLVITALLVLWINGSVSYGLFARDIVPLTYLIGFLFVVGLFFP